MWTVVASADFEAIVSGQRQLLDEGQFTKAIVNILKQIGGEKNQQAGTRSDLGGTTRGGSRGSQDNGNGASLVNVSILLAFLAVILRFL
ncbi:unnamed protein product [Anisakis simplex]|uniref:PGG domain-containing protein n=1 Tax=Anisakis simplex TaxID=6269 RepID=A0A0M3K8K0_ANISI|nr:unnamed protein product [Anisakis simplex]